MWLQRCRSSSVRVGVFSRKRTSWSSRGADLTNRTAAQRMEVDTRTTCSHLNHTHICTFKMSNLSDEFNMKPERPEQDSRVLQLRLDRIQQPELVNGLRQLHR